MLQPKRTKFRKMHKGRIKGEAKGGSDLNFGTYGLKALQPERVTARQIEAARIAVTRYMKREGKVWIRIFPDKPILTSYKKFFIQLILDLTFAIFDVDRRNFYKISSIDLLE